MVHPENILEVGTFTGYSTICLAEGLSETGHLHTIEINPEMEETALHYFEEAGLQSKITLHIGNALDVIPTLKEQFGLVFLDADKENYLRYYQLLWDRITPGGYLLADNVLWGGKIFNKIALSDKETLGIIEFNEFVQNDSRVENLLLPFRDGLMLVRKLYN